jgi:hypothetical protein
MNQLTYDECIGCTTWDVVRWRGAATSAIRGHRGQAFLTELLSEMDRMPSKRLITNNMEKNGEVCALGVIGRKRGIDMTNLDIEDSTFTASALHIADAMVCEIIGLNDDTLCNVTPEQRFTEVRAWVQSLIKKKQPVARA